MRKASLLFCCLFLAFAFAGVSGPLLATDLNSRHQANPAHRSHHDDELKEERVGEFCYRQRVICRKICDLRSRFDDRFDGCPQSCESRELRCVTTACYRWTEPDFSIAERFGGSQCAL
jgi:hypothetical protein